MRAINSHTDEKHERLLHHNHEYHLSVQNVQLASRISPLFNIAAAVTMFKLPSIVTTESEHLASPYPYYDKRNVYFTLAAFIALNIFEAFFFQKLFSVIS